MALGGGTIIQGGSPRRLFYDRLDELSALFSAQGGAQYIIQAAPGQVIQAQHAAPSTQAVATTIAQVSLLLYVYGWPFVPELHLEPLL